MKRIKEIFKHYGITEELLQNMDCDEIKHIIFCHYDYIIDLDFDENTAFLESKKTGIVLDMEIILKERDTFAIAFKDRDMIENLKIVNMNEDLKRELRFFYELYPEWIYSLIHTKLKKFKLKTEFKDYIFQITRKKDGTIDVNIKVIYQYEGFVYTVKLFLKIKDNTVIDYKKQEKPRKEVCYA